MCFTLRMTEAEVIERLKDACALAGSARAWGEKHGVSGQYIGAVIARRRPPGKKVLQALGIVRVTEYHPSTSESYQRKVYEETA